MVGKTTESSTGTSSIVSISFSKSLVAACLLNVSEYRDGKCGRLAMRKCARGHAREAAAAAAAELVEPGMTIGLGSGRAVWASPSGSRAGTRAVVASERTRERALAAGIEVVELDGTFELDLALDGADEIDPSLGLIKGGGGALLREKIVISAARRFVVVAEASKKVERLGDRASGCPSRWCGSAGRTRAGGCRRCCPTPSCAAPRTGSAPYVTDEGHYILDCAIPTAPIPPALAAALAPVPGVVEHGLFLDMADLALLGHPDGTVERLERTASKVRSTVPDPGPSELSWDTAAPAASGRPAGGPAGGSRARSCRRR